MKKVFVLLVIFLFGLSAAALEIQQDPITNIPPLSVHDFIKTSTIKKFKLIVLIIPSFEEGTLNFSGFKIEIRINDMPKFSTEKFLPY